MGSWEEMKNIYDTVIKPGWVRIPPTNKIVEWVEYDLLLIKNNRESTEEKNN